MLRKYTHKWGPEQYFPDISLGPAANVNACWASAPSCHITRQSPRLNLFWPEALGSLTIQSLECFLNWTTGLAIRFCFCWFLRPTTAFFENFESLMYDFILPILLAKLASCWNFSKLQEVGRPKAAHPSLSQSAAALSAPTWGHPAIDAEGCCVTEQTGPWICEDLCLSCCPSKFIRLWASH